MYPAEITFIDEIGPQTPFDLLIDLIGLTLELLAPLLCQLADGRLCRIPIAIPVLIEIGG